MKTLIRVILIVFLPASLYLVVERASGDDRSPNRDAKTFTGMFPALDALATAHNVRFGLEVFDDGSDRGTISLDLSDEVPGILDDLVRQRPRYQWNLDKGVYDITLKGASKGLSETNIALYYVRDATADENSDELDRLPEFRDWLALHNATRRELLTGRRSASNQKINLQLNPASLRSVLNEIINGLGDPHWMILHYGDKMQFVGIYF